MRSLVFKPRLMSGLAVLLGMALFIHLGQWQAGKAQRRSEEIAQFRERSQQAIHPLTGVPAQAQTLQDLPVTVRGTWESEHQFYLDNRVEDGQPGLHLITPLRIAGSQMRVLVNRGWVAWPQRNQPLPSVATPAGEMILTGIAAVPSYKRFFLMPEREDGNPRLVMRVDMERLAARFGGALQPLIVLQTSDTGDGLLRRWPEPEDRVARHRSYAFQWYGMAVALAVFYLVASLRRKEPGA